MLNIKVQSHTRMRSTHTIYLSLAVLMLTQCSITTAPEPMSQPDNERTSAINIPLNDPTTFTFEENTSGLYPWGNTLILNDYRTNYIAKCKSIKAIDSNGVIKKSGKVVILGLGGSNPSHIYQEMKAIHLAQYPFGKSLVVVDGAIGGKDLPDILNPDASYWNQVKKQLDSLHVTESQVQVIFCIQDDFSLDDTTLLRAVALKESYLLLLDLVRVKYPNCKMFLVGDRGYNDYATLPKYWEPKGYLNGWGVKLLVQDYANNLLPEYPFVNWLDYYWANGTIPRWDGLTYSLSDFLPPIYSHLTDEKITELATATHNKLKIDVGAKYWYK